ncbi:MAG: hypothetical protein ACRCUY_09190 [Thermoguttaceae bacterium]
MIPLVSSQRRFRPLFNPISLVVVSVTKFTVARQLVVRVGYEIFPISICVVLERFRRLAK